MHFNRKGLKMSDMHPLIAAALAAPKTHECVTVFASGVERVFQTRSQASAETHAIGERRKIGRDLIRRETGETVRVIGVIVRPISKGF